MFGVSTAAAMNAFTRLFSDDVPPDSALVSARIAALNQAGAFSPPPVAGTAAFYMGTANIYSQGTAQSRDHDYDAGPQCAYCGQPVTHCGCGARKKR